MSRSENQFGDRLTGIANRGTGVTSRGTQAGMLVAQKAAPKQGRDKTPAKVSGREAGGWKTPFDNFVPEQAKYIDQMFLEPSPIQQFLKNAVDSSEGTGTVAGHLKIYGTKDYLREKELVDGTRNINTGGFIDKRKGIIYLHDRNGYNYTKVEPPVHEGIHLLSHPPGATNKPTTFRAAFQFFLYEGATQYFTELILSAQGFNNWHTGTYARELAPVTSILRWLVLNGESGMQLLAKAYFEGDVQQLIKAMSKIWTSSIVAEWMHLLMLAGKTSISKYEMAHELLQKKLLKRREHEP